MAAHVYVVAWLRGNAIACSATLKDGRPVVVKVMMTGIERKFRADLAPIIAFCKLAQVPRPQTLF
jgi:predicted unusual protein kinase regulating ubiquinone biosynthesis (AarF/ABC1/UbiB family)